MNKTENTQPTVKTSTVAVVSGATLVAAASFLVGFKSGFKLKSMTMDLQAHQLILMRMREINPELVDDAVNKTIATATAVYEAANQK